MIKGTTNGAIKPTTVPGEKPNGNGNNSFMGPTRPDILVSDYSGPEENPGVTGGVEDEFDKNEVLNSYYRLMQDVIKGYSANPLETDWGKSLLDAYGVKGYNAGQGVKATAAAENAGNIDSYAVANAERQRVATLGQGIEAINGMNAERNANLINLLNNIGVNTQTLLGLSDPATPATVVNKIPTPAELAQYMQGYYNQASKSGQYETEQDALNAVADMMRSSEEFSYIPYYLYWEAMKYIKENNGI